MGPKCTDACPEGFFGKGCAKICDCPSREYICDSVHGCVKQKCNDIDGSCGNRIRHEKLTDEAEHTNLAVAIGIPLAIILIIVSVLLIFYCKRKMSHLKSDLTYSSDAGEPASVLDDHHFNNPIYSYPCLTHDAGNLSLNNSLSRNTNSGTYCNLDLEKSNLDKMISSKDNEDENSEKDVNCGSDYSSLDESTANKDFGYRNNIYHAIEEMKPYLIVKDSIYDSQEKTEGESPTYDHPKYTPIVRVITNGENILTVVDVPEKFTKDT